LAAGAEVVLHVDDDQNVLGGEVHPVPFFAGDANSFRELKSRKG
jgi:hypothetical protein